MIGLQVTLVRDFTDDTKKEVGQVLNRGGRNAHNTLFPIIGSFQNIFNLWLVE